MATNLSTSKIEQFCQERMSVALSEFMQVVAEDYAEVASKASGLHKDYFFSEVNHGYWRELPKGD